MRRRWLIALALAGLGAAGERPARRVTLEDCRRWFAERAAALHAAQLGARLRAAELAEVERALLPTLRVGAAFRGERVPITSTFIDTRGIYERTSGRIEAALSGDLPTGGRYDLSLREEVATIDAQSVNLSPFFTTTLTLGLRQPFLQGRGRPPVLGEALRARQAVVLATLEAAEQTAAHEAELERRYWTLGRAERRLDAAVRLRELAERRVGLVARAVQQGRAAEREQAHALEELERATAYEVARRRERTTAEHRLLAYLLDADEVAAGRELPRLETATEPEHARASRAAPEAHPRIRRLEGEVERWRHEAELARDRGRARLDAVARLDSVGLAGRNVAEARGLPAPPDRLVGGFGQSFSNALSERFLAFEVGLELTLPLGLAVAPAGAEAARVELERSRRVLELARVEVALGIRDAARALDAESSRADTLAREARQAARRADGERASVEAGRGDELRVLDSERAALEAQLRAGEARFDVALRAVDLAHGASPAP